jgi:hypothetical protein
MKAHFEHLVSIVRIGDDSFSFKDPYLIAVVARWVSPTEIIIEGLDKTMHVSGWKAIVETSKTLGITKIYFDRIKNGVVSRKTVLVERDME